MKRLQGAQSGVYRSSSTVRTLLIGVLVVLLIGLGISGYVLVRGDADVVKSLIRGRNAASPRAKVVALRDALNDVISVLQDVPSDTLQECIRVKLLDLRRSFESGSCDPAASTSVSVAALSSSAPPISSSSSSSALSVPTSNVAGGPDEEVHLSESEQEFVRQLLRQPGKLSPTQQEALDAVRDGSPKLFQALAQEVVAELGDAPHWSPALPKGISGTSGIGGDGYPRWHRTLTMNPDTNDAIFVALVTYRDPQCPDSLFEAFSRALDPKRVFIGVVQQNRDTDIDCFEAYCVKAGSTCRPNQVRVIRMKDSDSRGVMMARWLASTLWSGERWYLQVDAHSGFNYAWDDMVISSIKRTGDDRAVLSHHPPDMAQWPSNMGSNVINICRYKWDETGLPRFSSILVNKRTYGITKPFPNAFIGAGMVFGRAQWVIDCPFDHYLSFLFSGEELLLSVCLFTKGWNIYNPDVLPVWHYYTRNIAGRENPTVVHLRDKAILRLKFLLGLIDASQVPADFLKDTEPFLMGSVRSREDFWDYSGIDWKNKQVKEPFCAVYTRDEATAKTAYRFHLNPPKNLPSLESYKLDAFPMVPIKYKTTAAPKAVYLSDVAKSEPSIPKPRRRWDA